MRVADKMAYNHVNRNISKNRTEMSDLQNQAATQKRVNKPSDDPLASTRVLGYRTEERGAAQFIKNISQARSFLEYTDQSLAEVTEALVRTKELALTQASDASSNVESKHAVASEIEQLLNQVIQVGNRKLGERFIFSGYKTDVQPFDRNGGYSGDDGDIRLQIQKDAFVPINISGDKVFYGRGLGDDGSVRARAEVPTRAEDLEAFKQGEILRKSENAESLENTIPIESSTSRGIDVFVTLKKIAVALRTNDKASVQESLDEIDSGLDQVIQARAQVGSRIQTLNLTEQGLQKSIADSRAGASIQEDVDAFQVVSDINKTDSALRATLETSGKLIQPSLLDFLK